jgi:hypothetical protein
MPTLTACGPEAGSHEWGCLRFSGIVAGQPENDIGDAIHRDQVLIASQYPLND